MMMVQVNLIDLYLLHFFHFKIGLNVSFFGSFSKEPENFADLHQVFCILISIICTEMIESVEKVDQIIIKGEKPKSFKY